MNDSAASAPTTQPVTASDGECASRATRDSPTATPAASPTTMPAIRTAGFARATFAVTVIGVTKTDFTVNICRTDYVRDNYTTSGWGQNLHLSYIAETPA